MRRRKGEYIKTKRWEAIREVLGVDPLEGGIRIQNLVAWSTYVATPSLSDLAKGAGIADITLSAWRRGERVPSPDRLRELARVLRDQSLRLEGRVDALRQAADEMETEGGRAAWARPCREPTTSGGQE